MLFSAIGISITMLTLLVANPQNTISQIISFSVGNMSFFSIYVGSILVSFHNGSSFCIILCILCRPLHRVLLIVYCVPFFTKCPGFLGERWRSPFKKIYYGNPRLTWTSWKSLDKFNKWPVQNWSFITNYPIQLRHLTAVFACSLFP
jgi:hypothetical protein